MECATWLKMTLILLFYVQRDSVGFLSQECEKQTHTHTPWKQTRDVMRTLLPTGWTFTCVVSLMASCRATFCNWARAASSCFSPSGGSSAERESGSVRGLSSRRMDRTSSVTWNHRSSAGLKYLTEPRRLCRQTLSGYRQSLTLSRCWLHPCPSRLSCSLSTCALSLMLRLRDSSTSRRTSFSCEEWTAWLKYAMQCRHQWVNIIWGPNHDFFFFYFLLCGQKPLSSCLCWNIM